VLDLDWRISVIGDRAFPRPARGGDAGQEPGAWSAAGGHGQLRQAFPGHGFVRADSHTDIPWIGAASRPSCDDAAPYAWLRSTLTAVMPAHVIYPKVDSRPAGFSRRWLQDILRTRLGFEAIISDDLSMEGARHRRPPGQPHRCRTGGIAGRVRPGAAVQPEPGEGAPWMICWMAWPTRCTRPLAAQPGQRCAPPGAVA
jgi:hypothetical protein